ncbi:MAG: transposase [Lentisphaeria bacterium]|nr:transposase [Lentisphaeria bacterium]
MKFDTRFMYLMEQKVPSYSTISMFCNNIVVARQKKVFSCIVEAIIKKYNIDTADVFLDGTKLEANANKYKFVWKPRQRHDRLNEGLRKIISNYFPLAPGKKEFISKEVASYLSLLERKISEAGILIVSGSGHRQPQIVKDFHSLKKMLLKTLEYEEIEAICGSGRNSYYKTDKDATAMCLKSDYYSGLGSNMHAAYALQIIVSKGFILDFLVSQDRTDSKTFIPLLDQYYADYNTYPERLCADSGYYSLDNYRYMVAAGIENYIKPQTWQKMICGEWMELYHFDENKNLICLNGKVAVRCQNGNTHSRGRETVFYHIENCRRCKFKPYCMKTVKDKNRQDRFFEVCYDLYVFRKQAIENLLSPKGIEMRINRSAQVEGVFGVIKQDMDYERVRRKGLENVSYECMLVCLGYNIRKLFTLIAGKGKIDYWIAPDGLEAESPRIINMERIIKKLRRKEAAAKH